MNRFFTPFLRYCRGSAVSGVPGGRAVSLTSLYAVLFSLFMLSQSPAVLASETTAITSMNVEQPAAAVAAPQELQQFDSEQQRQLYLKLTAELRCPQCQNQNIADSNAVVAVDMREKTYELVQQGLNRNDVLDYMIDRYGDFVHYQPPVNRVTIWLWLAPVLLLIGLFLLQLKRRATQMAPPETYPHNSGTGLTSSAAATASHPHDTYPHVSGTKEMGTDRDEVNKITESKIQLNKELDQIIEHYRSKKS